MPRGAVLDMEQIWTLARLWYHDRQDPGWMRRTPAEATAAFASLGLTGQFWELV
jgi:hypothetical protein